MIFPALLFHIENTSVNFYSVRVYKKRYKDIFKLKIKNR